MERTKKILITVIVTALVVIAACVWQYFALRPPGIALSVEITDAAKAPGQTATLEISVEKNPGFTDLSVYMDYDRERLELVGIEDHYSILDGPDMAYLPEASVTMETVEFDGRETGYIKVTAPAPIEEKERALFALTFEVRPKAEIGVATVSLFAEQFSCTKNGKTRELRSTVTDGGVLVGVNTCRHSDGDRDMFCDHCGARLEEAERLGVEDVYVSVEDGIRMNIAIAESILVGEGHQALITKGNGGNEQELRLPLEQWALVGDHYVIACPIRPMELADPVSIEIKNADDELCGAIYQVCVRDIVMEKLEDEAVCSEEKTMYVDLLNFGAEAQDYFVYDVRYPVNSLLDETQQALATQPIVCKDESVRGEHYMGAYMALKDRMDLAVYFKGKRSSGMYAEASYTDYAGELRSIHISSDAFRLRGGDGFGVPLQGLPIAEAFTPITVKVYLEDGSIYGVCAESVSSVCARTPNDTAELFAAFIKLAASTREYLLSE